MAAKTTQKAKHPAPLSKQRVLEAAVLLADEIGIASLSMRKLGQALGVEAMSLYKHVANKDDILDGIVDIVAGEIEVPAVGGDWKAAMRRRAISAHQVLMRHPWATMLIVSRANVGPAMLRYVDATIGCLREAGFSYAMADHAWNAIDSYVYGFTLQKLNFPFQPEEYAKMAKAFLPRIPPEAYPYLNGMSQEVIAGRHDGLHDLAFGLDLVLDGLEAILAGRGRKRHTRRR
jgi:AcrR family transcriptional regulator